MSGRAWAVPMALALAAAAMACPQIDFVNYDFACTTVFDCDHMKGEQCIDGHCRDCDTEGCTGPGLDAATCGCAGRECGDDGCGGPCGTCVTPKVCSEKGLCVGADAGAGQACLSNAGCNAGAVCIGREGGGRCAAACAKDSDCGPLHCKLARHVGGTEVVAVCMASSYLMPGSSCTSGEDCISFSSCDTGVCRETCSPDDSRCLRASQHCETGKPGFPSGWGYCVE